MILSELTNAPVTFCNLMNDIFHDFVDQFVVVYLNIVVFSELLEDHVEHLRKMLAKFR